MATVNPLAPIAFIHGKLRKSDDIYYTVRGGKQIAVRMRPHVDRPTQTQIEHRQRMRDCNAIVNSLMACPEHRVRYAQEWQQALANGTDHHTRLRDYIYALTYRKLYSEVESKKSKVESL